MHIAILEAEWAYLSRPDRVMTLSNDLLQMAPIGQDRILPLNAIPMRIDFNIDIDGKIGEATLKKMDSEPEHQNSSPKVDSHLLEACDSPHDC